MHDDERKIDPRLGRSHGGRRCPRISPYVVVRFTAEFLRRTGIPYDDEVPGEHLGGELWQAISGGDPRVRLRSVDPAVNSRSFKAYDAFVARQSKEPLPNLRGFYRITGPRETDFARILSVLLAAKGVAEPKGTYFERPSLPPQVDPTGQPMVAKQRYLELPLGTPVGGINARAVWPQPGCDGAGVRFVDVERGWDLAHPDLPPLRAPAVPVPLIHGLNDAGFDDHGTGVLGILCATDAASGSNAIGGVGIAPRAEGYLSSWFMGYTDEWEEISNIPGAILAAALKLFDLRLATAGPPSGEVILIETTVDADVDLGGGVTALLQVPVEANYGNWTRPRATLAGITVVEAGGNGDQAGTGAPLDMVLAANPDSEAIIVSAAQPLGGWFERTAWARAATGWIVSAGRGCLHLPLDRRAWRSLPRRLRRHLRRRGEVAGAAIALQGLARVTPRLTAGGYVPAHLLTQGQVRLALKDARWSTPAMDPANPAVPDPSIGRMPDLGALWPALANGTLDGL